MRAPDFTFLTNESFEKKFNHDREPRGLGISISDMVETIFLLHLFLHPAYIFMQNAQFSKKKVKGKITTPNFVRVHENSGEDFCEDNY
jgi:hypothetical protein